MLFCKANLLLCQWSYLPPFAFNCEVESERNTFYGRVSTKQPREKLHLPFGSLLFTFQIKSPKVSWTWFWFYELDIISILLFHLLYCNNIYENDWHCWSQFLSCRPQLDVSPSTCNKRRQRVEVVFCSARPEVLSFKQLLIVI